MHKNETPFEKIYHIDIHLSATGKALLEVGLATKNLPMLLPFLQAILDDCNKQDDALLNPGFKHKK
jgi:hypothetical protein